MAIRGRRAPKGRENVAVVRAANLRRVRGAATKVAATTAVLVGTAAQVPPAAGTDNDFYPQYPTEARCHFPRSWGGAGLGMTFMNYNPNGFGQPGAWTAVMAGGYYWNKENLPFKFSHMVAGPDTDVQVWLQQLPGGGGFFGYANDDCYRGSSNHKDWVYGPDPQVTVNTSFYRFGQSNSGLYGAHELGHTLGLIHECDGNHQPYCEMPMVQDSYGRWTTDPYKIDAWCVNYHPAVMYGGTNANGVRRADAVANCDMGTLTIDDVKGALSTWNNSPW